MLEDNSDSINYVIHHYDKGYFSGLMDLIREFDDKQLMEYMQYHRNKQDFDSIWYEKITKQSAPKLRYSPIPLKRVSVFYERFYRENIL